MLSDDGNSGDDHITPEPRTCTLRCVVCSPPGARKRLAGVEPAR